MLPRVGIVATSSPVPELELRAGVEHLRSLGWSVEVHPETLSRHWIHSGTDESRAGAFFDYAVNSEVDVIWAARGGYGAAKILPILDRLTSERGVPPKKLLVGYSDLTVLHQFVRDRWGWSTLHAAMPGWASFTRMPPADFESTIAAISRQTVSWPWEHVQLKWVCPPTGDVEGVLLGGNLSLWQNLAGTPYAPPRRPHVLFLEDVGEKFYRIDRMMTHLDQSGMLDACQAVILGDFTDCDDEANTSIAEPPPEVSEAEWLASPGSARKALRDVHGFDDLMTEVFIKIARRREIPLAVGLPVGHGPRYAPLPLGARYQISSAGDLRLLEWDWTVNVA